MAIIGGAGNPVGGSFTGPAEALEIYGDHAAAYSGELSAADAGATFTSFTSGNYLFVGTFQVLTADQSGNEISATVKFNGSTIVKQTYRNDGNGPAGIFPLDIIIPSYTEVEVILTNESGGGNKTYSTALVGKIFREQ